MTVLAGIGFSAPWLLLGLLVLPILWLILRRAARADTATVSRRRTSAWPQG